MKAKVAWPSLLIGLPLLILAVAWFVFPLRSLQTPVRQGPPLLVAPPEGEALLWMTLVQLEEIITPVSGGYSTGRGIRTDAHLRLVAFDPVTVRPQWTRTLAHLERAGSGARPRLRLLGQQEGVVWAFVHDQPMALSSRDGSLLADRAGIERHNPDLAGLLPEDMGLYAFDEGLVFTAADGRVLRIAQADARAEAYRPVSTEAWHAMQFRVRQWNGGYSTAEFGLRQARFDTRWIGLHSAAEAEEEGRDHHGDHLKRQSGAMSEQGVPRRSLHTARIGLTTGFSSQVERLFDVAPLRDRPEIYLGGLFLTQAGADRPIALEDPAGTLIVHHTRVDERGRLSLTRVDSQFVPVWQQALPFTDLVNRYELPGRLMLRGLRPDERGRSTDVLVGVDLATGQWTGWDVIAEEPLRP